MNLMKPIKEWEFYWIKLRGKNHWEIAQCRRHPIEGLMLFTTTKKAFHKEQLQDCDDDPIKRNGED